ncbi:MAG: rhomboid family intramembrane serine protease [Candidatus Bathyarchaeota archaeon]|nr:rhomboid family intramembrane serine protease [Candidatus Bathyarchaeota archaeon]MDH5780075.1 rhomboid family intramembrane serine protease [Candidatus Bathyarchaeota archaeon]
MKALKDTNKLIVICALVTLFFWSMPSVTDFLVYSGSGLADGYLWTLITALFVHVNLLHLIGNMIFLYVFGNAVESSAGGKVMMAVFFVGGVGSFLVGTYYYGYTIIMVGASAAIFALAAAAMLMKPLKSSLLFFFMPLGLVAVLFFIFNLLAVYFSVGGNVGYVGHVAGFLIGIPFGMFLSKGEWVKNLGITLLLLIGFVAVILLISIAFVPFL